MVVSCIPDNRKMEWVLACGLLLAISALRVEGNNYGKGMGKSHNNSFIIGHNFILHCVRLL